MSNDPIKYHADLIRHSTAILQGALVDLEKGNELNEITVYGIMGIVVYQIQSLLNIATATDEVTKRFMILFP